MNMSQKQKWIQFLKEIVGSMQGSSLFVIVIDPEVLQVDLPSAPSEKMIDQYFQIGREFALSHPSTWQAVSILQIRRGLQDFETETVLVSCLDNTTGKVDAIPYAVIRDKQGKMIDLRDEGGIVQIAGAYLPAFYVGMRTAHLSERQARGELAKEVNRLANELGEELRRRIGG